MQCQYLTMATMPFVTAFMATRAVAIETLTNGMVPIMLMVSQYQSSNANVAVHINLGATAHRVFLERLAAAKMTVNLTKSDFAHAFVTYLGHIVGQGQVRLRDAKVKCRLEYPVPTTRQN